jgi:luciferase family oxidoreductase group 1
MALRGGTPNRAAEDFPRHLLDVLGLLGDRRTERGLWEQLRATPAAVGTPLVVLLGSSDFSAQLAGVLGLPFGFAHHFDMGGTVEAVQIYRDHFEPSVVLDEPLTIVTATAVAAETSALAHHLAGPSRLVRYGIRSGQSLPFLSPAAAEGHPLFRTAVAAPSQALIGDPSEVAGGLADLVDRTGADEVMLHVPLHGLEDRLTSLRLTTEAWETLLPATAG